MVYDKTDTYYMVLPEYGKQRLLTYAESLNELSDSYQSLEEESAGEWDKREVLLRQQLYENRSVVSGQLAAVSRILRGLAGEAFCSSPSMEKHKKQIVKTLTDNGLEIRNMYTVANRNGYLEIGMTLRSGHREDLFEATDIAEYLSRQLHNRMDVSPSAPAYIGEEYVNVVFREEVRYYMTAASARATKEGEVCSGDNFTMTELSDGSYIAAISDGMGSGEAANQDSGMVIELLEELLEAGFEKETAAGMINDLLLVRSLEPRTATLDLIKCSLYSGEFSFLKTGAAPSFVVSGGIVKPFMTQSLPLGLLAGGREKEQSDSLGGFLRIGDIVVMLSDGVTDSIAEKSPEAEPYLYIRRFLEGYDFVSCKDLANQLLGMAIMCREGYIQDDMTVLVMQLQER